MKILLNRIKEKKKFIKRYNKDLIKDYRHKDSEYCKIWLKLLKAKTSKKCRDIIEKEIDKSDIKLKSLFISYFCDPWIVVGKKENRKDEYIILGKENNISLRKLKKVMKKNNYEELILKNSIPMLGIYEEVVKIRNL
jgi:hypothetical protein